MGLVETYRRNRATVVVAAVLLAIGAALAAWAWAGRAAGAAALVARVHDGDGGVHELPLAEDGELTVTTALGTNTVRVEGGAARIVDADCPRGDCLRQAPISRPGEQLICLPHRLWVEVVTAGGPDGELDLGAASTEDGAVDLVAGGS